jgi:hypothetical protein
MKNRGAQDYPKHTLITDLASSPELFKVIVTSQPRGSIPANV